MRKSRDFKDFKEFKRISVLLYNSIADLADYNHELKPWEFETHYISQSIQQNKDLSDEVFRIAKENGYEQLDKLDDYQITSLLENSTNEPVDVIVRKTYGGLLEAPIHMHYFIKGEKGDIRLWITPRENKQRQFETTVCNPTLDSEIDEMMNNILEKDTFSKKIYNTAKKKIKEIPHFFY